jgi:hypothetical protein
MGGAGSLISMQRAKILKNLPLSLLHDLLNLAEEHGAYNKNFTAFGLCDYCGSF